MKIIGDYIKISEKEEQSEFVKIGQLVQKREYKFSYYAVEGNIGYFFYKKYD